MRVRGGRAAIAVLLVSALAGAAPAVAATRQAQTAWWSFTGTHRIDERWSATLDLGLRTADDWDYVRNAEVRPGVAYVLAPQLTLALGYAYLRNLDRGIEDTTEQRAVLTLTDVRRRGGARLSNRLRLEERFLEKAGRPDVQATRLRWRVKGQLPLSADWWMTAQHELLVHVTGRSGINGQTFEQDRVGTGIGHRFGAALETELGYLHQYVNQRGRDTRNHVVQLSVTGRF